jgi:hypothetical protein
MPDNTPILQLPLILPAQAQKHVTHNEALRLLDVMVQLSVLTRTLTVPPATPSVGDRHIVPTGATGSWAGQAGRIALAAVTGWEFIQPLTGWTAQVMAEGQAAVFDGVVWKSPSDGTVTVARLGVSTAADATNRLAVSSPATLLNHAGAGHQVKVNKAAAGDTASLLFQTGFSGRAEMGTAGSDDFAIKVSANGSAFFTALQTAGATGEVTLPAPVHLGGQASDPASPPNGTLWLNTTTGAVKLRSAGVTQTVGGGGVSDGDKGDVAVSGSGAVWTIDAGVVSLSKMADLATSTMLGRATAGTGAPEALTPAQVRTILNVANGATANSADATLLARANHTGTQAAATITGLAGIATSGSASDLGAGTLPAARFDDTAHGSRAGGALHSAATTSVAGFMSGADKTKLDGIAAGAQVNVATDLTYTAASRLLESSTGADVALPLVTSGNAGLAPASGGGATNFLRADGTWATPGGGIGDLVGPAAASNNAVARFDSTTGKLVKNSAVLINDAGEVRLPYVTSPSTPATDTMNVLMTELAGTFPAPAFVGPDGFLHTLAESLGEFTVMRFQPQPNSPTPQGDSSLLVATTGTGTSAAIAANNLHFMMRRIDLLVTVAASNAVAGLRASTNLVRVGRSAGAPGGFLARCIWGPATGVATTTNRAFVGMIPSVAPTDVEPSTLLNMIGMGWDAADANIQLMRNDGTGTATKIDLGASFPVPTVDRQEVYELQLYSPDSTIQSVSYRVIRYATTGKTIAAEATGTVTTDLPAVTQLLALRAHMSVGGTSSVIGIAVMGMYLATVF